MRDARNGNYPTDSEQDRTGTAAAPCVQHCDRQEGCNEQQRAGDGKAIQLVRLRIGALG
jgi:hypothetical protein